MIFAAYAGTGKSYVAEKYDNVLDMVIVPYKYKFPKEYKKEAFMEADKGGIEFPFNENYPERYVDDIMKNIETYEHIMIPSDNRVMDVLEERSVEYILCYPDKRLKLEYQRRYQERGNTEVFMRIFVDRWDAWIGSFERRCCKKYVMDECEFMSDLLEKYIAAK